MRKDGYVAKRKRGAETVRDMVLTLGVIAVFILFLLEVAPHSAAPFKPVDYTAQLTDARAAAPYHVLAPVGLSADWKANTADYNGSDPADASWHIGFVTPTNHYATLDQTTGPANDALNAAAPGAIPAGTVTLAGTVWQRYDGKTSALVHTDGHDTTVVAGTGGLDEITQLASSLH